MPQQVVYTDEIEDAIVNKYSDLWNKSKMDTIKRIIRLYDELNSKIKLK